RGSRAHARGWRGDFIRVREASVIPEQAAVGITRARKPAVRKAAGIGQFERVVLADGLRCGKRLGQTGRGRNRAELAATRIADYIHLVTVDVSIPVLHRPS